MLPTTKPLFILLIYSVLYLSLSIGQEPSNWLKEVEIADTLQKQKKYEEASEHWKKAYRLSVKEPDSVKNWLLFKQLYAKGVSYNYEMDGIAFLEKAYPLLPYSRLDISDQSTFLNTYYHFLGYNNRWEEALPLARECVKLRKTLDEAPPLSYLSSVHDVAFINNKIGNYPEAIEYYHQAIAGYATHNGVMDHDVALGYNNLAFNYGLMGMANKEYENYAKAAKIWSSIELADNSYLLTVYANLLRWQKQYGDQVAMEGILASIREIVYSKSKGWGTQNRILANKDDFENHHLILSYWKSHLDYHLVKKDIQGIKNYLDSTSQFVNRLSKKPNEELLGYVDNAYSVLGEAYAESDDHQAAIQSFQSGLTYVQQHGYSGALHHTHAKLAKSLMAVGRLSDAKHHLQQAFKQNKNASNLPVFHTLSAELAQKSFQPDSVRHRVGKALATLTQNEELKNDYTQLTSNSFQGRLNRNYISSLSANGYHLLRLYRSKKSMDDLRNANHLFGLALGMLNTYYLGGPYTDALADMQTAIHFGLLECQKLLQQQQTDHVSLAVLFENLENNRSQHRWKKFIKHAPTNSTMVPDSLRDAEEEQRQLLIFYKQQLAKIDKDSLQSKQANLWRAKIHSCETDLNDTEKRMLALNPQYKILSQGMVSTHAIQKKLAKDVSMLRYMFTDSGAYALHLDHTSISLFSLGSADSIEVLVRQANEQLQTRSHNYYVTATKLYDRLLVPDMVQQLKPTLILVPDGVLHQLPFEALTHTETPAGFLLHDHTISYAGSTALWLAQQGLRHAQKMPFGAFAPEYAGYASDKRSASSQKLSGATKEAEIISKMLDGKVFHQNHFGKHDFINEAPNYSLLHLAMHADVQEDDSEQSNFHFGDGSKLYAYELYGMKLQANMAVLSACNTGYGHFQKGEGVQSLATAFTHAGVPCLVMGLWSLPDASTSGIMVDYYQQLMNNKHKHKALATAKTNYLKRVENEIELQHPFYWAGLVVSGDTAPIHTRETIWYWIGAVGILLVVAIMFRKHQGRKTKINKSAAS